MIGHCGNSTSGSFEPVRLTALGSFWSGGDVRCRAANQSNESRRRAPFGALGIDPRAATGSRPRQGRSNGEAILGRRPYRAPAGAGPQACGTERIRQRGEIDGGERAGRSVNLHQATLTWTGQMFLFCSYAGVLSSKARPRALYAFGCSQERRSGRGQMSGLLAAALVSSR